MSFSFGSFGDILGIAQLAFILAKTLSDTRGSSAEYQELVTELHSLSSTLEILNRVLSVRAPSRPLQISVEIEMKTALKKCQILLSDFGKRIEGYEHCLKKGGSGSKLRDILRQIRWGIVKKAEVVDLKNKLMEQKAMIGMMIALTNRWFRAIAAEL